MNERKFCFVICSNDELQLQECILYLNLLHVPEGYQAELITVTDTPSTAAAYNEGMKASDAKYKIYLQQNSFIVEHYFLDKLLDLFQKDSKIGMAGTSGTEQLPKDGVIWHGERCGNVYLSEQRGENITALTGQDYLEVEAIDGGLMATQYDLPWREELFPYQHFHDISQCMEFHRAGYKIVVPRQDKTWLIHSRESHSPQQYEESRQALLQAYPEITGRRKEQKRILFIHSKQIQLPGIAIALTELGHDVVIAPYIADIKAMADTAAAEQEKIEELLEEGHYELVVTYNFIPTVSNACLSSSVPYYAWVYDSPFMTLYSREALNEVNYISIFDRKEYRHLCSLGLKHLFYLPLASETDHFGAVCIRENDEKNYSSDISFVGRLCIDHSIGELIGREGTVSRQEAEEVIMSMDCVWNGTNSIYSRISQEAIDYMISRVSAETWNLWNVDKRFYCESQLLAQKCNETERIRILSHIQKHYPIAVYSDALSGESLKDLKIRPWLDYYSEMPKVFHLSKINLNITSRSIESGIPQRVWDIMVVGGFCLTNYQPELEEYFEIGTDLEVYHNLQELEEKIQYYLTHEEQRIRIAINGYRKVRQKHSLKTRLSEALHFIFGSSEKVP